MSLALVVPSVLKPNGSFNHLKTKVKLEDGSWSEGDSAMLVPAQPGAIHTFGQVLAFQGFTLHAKVESYALRKVKLRLWPSTEMTYGRKGTQGLNIGGMNR